MFEKQRESNPRKETSLSGEGESNFERKDNLKRRPIRRAYEMKR